jgi:CubicO group peptidase (beta-lactamase class C family)
MSASTANQAVDEHFALDAFANSAVLGEKLNSARIGTVQASVIVRMRDQLFVASRFPGASETPMAISCIAKAITGALVGFAVIDGKIGLDDHVTDVLDTVPRSDHAFAYLSKVTVRHLLTHTDGLDDPLCASAPTTGRGFIDVPRLCSELFASRPLAAPGTIYRYSSTGPWLAAAILERLSGETFLTQVERSILAPVGVAAKFPNGRRQVCPSDGGDLQLSAHDLVRLAGLFFLQDGEQTARAHHLKNLADECSYLLPSWPQTEGERVSLGWINHGVKGMGHYGTTSDASVMLRVFPEIGAAVAIAAWHPLVAYRVQQHIFGSALSNPKSASGCMLPRALTSSEWSAADVSPYMGEFRNSRFLIRVDVLREQKTLRAIIFRRFQEEGEHEPLVERRFIPACDHMFYPTPPEPKLFPMLQFSHPGNDGAFTVLNTGRSVLARCEPT